MPSIILNKQYKLDSSGCKMLCRWALNNKIPSSWHFTLFAKRFCKTWFDRADYKSCQEPVACSQNQYVIGKKQ